MGGLVESNTGYCVARANPQEKTVKISRAMHADTETIDRHLEREKTKPKLGIVEKISKRGVRNRRDPQVAMLSTGMGTSRFIICAIVCVLLDDDEAQLVSFLKNADLNSYAMAFECRKSIIGSQTGRRSTIPRNDINWIYEYGLGVHFKNSPQWRSTFRVSYEVYCALCEILCTKIVKNDTPFRKALPVELQVGAFLYWSGSRSYSTVAAQFGIVVSTATAIVRNVPLAVIEKLGHEVSLPRTEQEIASVTRGFQNIAGLPYCVGAVDGCHIRWPASPSHQYFEYRCYKRYTSLVLFAVSDSRRRLLYADCGMPGVMGDSSIYNVSLLKLQID